jgi:hypothetical protein
MIGEPEDELLVLGPDPPLIGGLGALVEPGDEVLERQGAIVAGDLGHALFLRPEHAGMRRAVYVEKLGGRNRPNLKRGNLKRGEPQGVQSPSVACHRVSALIAAVSALRIRGPSEAGTA